MDRFENYKRALRPAASGASGGSGGEGNRGEIVVKPMMNQSKWRFNGDLMEFNGNLMVI